MSELNYSDDNVLEALTKIVAKVTDQILDPRRWLIEHGVPLTLLLDQLTRIY